MNSRPYLSVIVPSYNESIEIKLSAISAIDQYLKSQDYSYEVLIVDDKSTNNTLDQVKQVLKGLSNFKLVENGHGGKAITVMTGLLKSQGEIAIFTDMDQATPIDQVGRLLPKFTNGVDVVIGTREGREGAPLERKIMSWGFATLRNLLLGLPFSDTQCGFKGFSRAAIESIFPKMLQDWQSKKSSGAAVNAGFDVETLYIAKKRNLKVAEVVVVWHHVQNEKQVQALQDSMAAIQDMIQIRLNSWKGKYND